MKSSNEARRLGRSGNPERRAEGAKLASVAPRFPLWIKILLITVLAGSTFFTLLASWGFNGTPSADAFLLAGVISMACLSATLFLLRFIVGGVQSGAMRRLGVVVLSLALMAGALLTVASGLSEEPPPPPVSSSSLNGTQSQPSEGAQKP